MKVREIMSEEVALVTPGATLREAAEIIRDRGIGCLAVTDADRLIGIVTDRDLTCRGLAERRDPEACQSALDWDPESAFKRGSDLILMACRLLGTDDAGLEEIQLSATVHLALDELELGDLAFSLAIRPRRCDSGADGFLIFDDAVGE